MKKNVIISIFSVFVFLISTTGVSGQNIWNKTTSKNADDVIFIKSHLPSNYELYTVDSSQLESDLQQVAKRNSISLKNANTTFSVPDENGKMQDFKILESLLMDEELALKYPMIKTYVGQGITDPTATLRMSIGTDGLHIMILAAGKPALMIDPYTRNRNKYILYTSANLSKLEGEFNCEFENEEPLFKNPTNNSNPNKNATDGKLRTYRLAVATTIEYSAFHLTNQGVSAGATLAVKKAAVLSAIVNTINRVEGIYEKEFAVKFNLIANNDLIIFINSDNFSNSNASALINESQTEIDAAIGNANYDIGHTFSTGGGGVASLGGICTVASFGTFSRKAMAITGSSNPIGDFYDVDFVAHEMGHHFGANHTYNGQGVGNCTTSNSTTAGEPGSGTTIMAYAGICGSLNVQQNSDTYFHIFSLIEINDRLHNTNVLNNFTHPFWAQCAVETNTGNNEPTADAGLNYTIPKGTAYVLTGNGTDPDGDTVTFCWEQVDVQQPTVHPLVSTSTVGPAYRSLTPTINPKRFMPKFATVFGGSLASQWEVTPTVGRNLNFRLTTRDNRAIGGQTNSDLTQLTVSNTAGPFAVTSQTASETWSTGDSKTITWDVAGTTANSINEANVEITLIDSDGNTLATLLASTANDGSEVITVPNITTASTRIMVKAINNIFYAVNNAAISINIAPAYCNTLCSSSGSTQFPDGTTRVIFNTIDNTSTGASAYTDYTNISTDVTIGISYNLTIHSNTDGGFYESTRVWIDWNRDCIFNTTDEQYDLGSNFNSSNSATSASPFTIIVPANADLGETRMRVISAYSASGNSPLVYRNSCDTGFFGETEDYTINIVQPPICDNNTKTWNGSWSPSVPTIDNPVIIVGNYFTSISGSFECCTLTINNSVLVTIANGDSVKVKTDIVNNGQFNVLEQGNLVQVNDDATVTGSGNFVATVKTTVLQDSNRFTYFSSPNNTSTLSVFNSYATSNWDYDATIQNWNYLGNGSANSLMQKGKGYAVQGGSGSIETVTFLGTFNNGIVTQNLSFDVYNNVVANYPDPASNDDDSNFIGNPYPSAISADDLITNNDISAVYIWTHESAIAAIPTQQNPYADNDYIACVVGTCTDLNNAGNTASAYNGLIASGQGFFVTATAATNLTFNNAMRRTTGNDQFRAPNTTIEKLWLDLITPQGYVQQLVLTFTENGTANYDEKYEAKTFGNNYGLDFYSINETSDKLTINDTGLFNDERIIPLGFNINSPIINEASIAINRSENLDNINVYLKDNLLNVTHNLKISNYQYAITQTGQYNNRFELLFRNSVLNIDANNLIAENIIVFKENENTLNIKTKTGQNIKEINIYDILGKLIYKAKANASNLSVPLNNINLGSILIIKTNLENGKTINTKFIF